MKDSPKLDEATKDLPGKDEPTPAELPKQIGRYRIQKVLGQGGFGLVYLAHDDQLNRLVAVKVPHARLIARPADAEAYLAEARTVANLDHPNIVPVHDIGSTPECPCYVVSKYISGTDLATKIKQQRLRYREAAEVVATVADALHYAHKQAIVHRDVKPGNILMDGEGKPYVVDFGLALREENIGKGPRHAGTPAYMSPEQARGEGHRVDGRSDIFSLGVVLYELLAGRRPFRGDTQDELLEQVTSFEPRPLRQYDEQLPKELERICHKALSKRASDRHSSAHDMAEDLRHFLAEQTAAEISLPPVSAVVAETQGAAPASTKADSAASPVTGSFSDSQPIKIIPKGLRSFDAHDADFFLELLPGPRDREGLPDSIRFWKTRIEESDADNTFSVGLIYGPSGCGKSSLVKAGLLPRLSEKVISVYIEATPDDTETRLLHGLRKRCPALEDNLNLKETVAALRRGQGIPVGKKVLIVLDQFEQWLHSQKEEESAGLIQVLRQCDGGRVQCIVMVRDDFWMAATRFMRELEVRLVEAQNSAAVDLFPSRHAEKVLAAFGRAFGALPDNTSETSQEQKSFLKESVAGLAEEGKVICVRLALFGEMMKGKPWTPATLKAVGGTKGVGVTFLEETFSASTAPPEHRYHQKASRAVLKALLPESGTDIKGQMKSHEELLDASGYARRPKDFDGLIRILDSEIRLITPTDPEGSETEGSAASPAKPGAKYYQLTHDYLVHSLRDWLTGKQKETRRGRAELCLAERSATCSAKPERRSLPSLWEYLSIVGLAPSGTWTPPQRKMMQSAGRFHGLWSAGVALLLMVVVISGLTIRSSIVRQQNQTLAQGLVDSLLKADIGQVPAIVQDLAPYREWADPLLRHENEQAPGDSPQKLHTALALLPVDETQVAYLRDQLPLVTPTQFPVVRDALLPHRDQLVDPLWKFALDENEVFFQRRFQAACALATYSPGDQRWTEIDKPVAVNLVIQQPSEFVVWLKALQPARSRLIGPLAAIYRDASTDERRREAAAVVLSEFAADQPAVLFDLLADAEQFQFLTIFPRLDGPKGIPLAAAELTRQPADNATEDDKEHLAKRQANAAVALVRLGAAEKAWPLLRQSPDPRARSYFMHWLKLLLVEPKRLIERLEVEPDVSIRRALWLTLGEFDPAELPPADRQRLTEKLLALYESESDASLHTAAEWLLRTWGEEKQLRAVLEKLRLNEEQRKGPQTGEKRNWYINSQGQTMVILEPGDFPMGSPATESGRNDNETQHRRKIGRRFAIAAHEVTLAQFSAFQAQRPEMEKAEYAKWVQTPDSPRTALTWYESADYCNWLSEQDGLPEDQWCYEPNAEAPKPELKYGAGMRAKPNARELWGYRLPSEAEWEYACRAGTVTPYYHGSSIPLLAKYAWHLDNSHDRTWPVGSLKPNDWGLFDMLGNALEWTHDSYVQFPPPADQKPEPTEDPYDDQPVTDTLARMLRGGAFNYIAPSARSAYRYTYPPTYRLYNFGFRVARWQP